MPDREPAFIIIGAVKGATTWIAHQLREHPDLWLPNAEPHFFSTEYHRGPEWYASLFAAAPAGRILGEKSADYLAHPDAPARIAHRLPQARLIVQLRDPVQRAYSDYCMLYRRGMVGNDPRKHLTGDGAHTSRFLVGGMYGAHIKRYMNHFAREQLLVVLYETLSHSAESVLANVCQHIGVRSHVAPAAIAARKNDGAADLLPLSLRRILQPLRPVLDPLRSIPLFAQMRASLAAPMVYPPLINETRQIMRDFYRDDILWLQDFLEQDLCAWLSDSASPARTSPKLPTSLPVQ